MKLIEIRTPTKGLLSAVNPEVALVQYARDLINLVPYLNKLVRSPEYELKNNSLAGAPARAGAFYTVDEKWTPWVVVNGNFYYGDYNGATDTVTWYQVAGSGFGSHKFEYGGYVRLSDGTSGRVVGYWPEAVVAGKSFAAGWAWEYQRLEPVPLYSGDVSGLPLGMIHIGISESGSDGYFSAGDVVRFGLTRKRGDAHSYMTVWDATHTVSADGKKLTITLTVDGGVLDRRDTHFSLWIKINDSPYLLWRDIDLRSSVACVDDNNVDRQWSYDSMSDVSTITFVVDGSRLSASWPAVSGYSDDDIMQCDYNGNVIGIARSPYVSWKYATVASGRVVYAGVTVNGVEYNDRVYVSLPNYPDVIPEWAYLSVGSDDGDEIRALAYANGVLAVLKKNRLYVLDASSYDPTAWRVVATYQGIGVDNFKQVLVRGSEIYIASRNGLYLLSGVTLTRIDLPWSDYYEQLVTSGNVALGVDESRGELFVCNDATGVWVVVALESKMGRERFSAHRMYHSPILLTFIHPVVGPDGSFWMIGFDGTGTRLLGARDTVGSKPVLWRTHDLDVGRVYVRRIRLLGKYLEGASVSLVLDGNTAFSGSVTGTNVSQYEASLGAAGRLLGIQVGSTPAADFELHKVELWVEQLRSELGF